MNKIPVYAQSRKKPDKKMSFLYVSHWKCVMGPIHRREKTKMWRSYAYHVPIIGFLWGLSDPVEVEIDYGTGGW